MAKGVSMNFQRNQSILMKKIPLHYRRKFNNSSNGSFNTTVLTGAYKNKIRTLLRNNKLLAVSLQNDRSKKEELLEENKANANLIMFSRLKLASLSDSLKQVVTVLDETLGLLEMHSSASSTKFTPKHTVTREQFKEQVQNVLMDSIPEEPESPRRLSNMTGLNKKQSGVSPGFQVEMLNKKQEYFKKPTNSKKALGSTTNFEKMSDQKSKEIDEDILNHKGNYEFCFVESSPAKKSVRQIRKIANRNTNITSKVNKIKTETKPTADKKSRKVTKKSVSKGVASLNEGKNISELARSSENNPPLNELHNDIQIYADIQSPESKKKKKNENITFDETDVLKNSVPSKLQEDIVKNSNSRPGCEKENVSPYERPKLRTRKYKSMDTLGLEPTVTKRSHSRNSAMQSLSSEMNIENFKSMGKTVQIDDLVSCVTKRQSVDLIREGKSSESFDTSKSYLIDLSLQQSEMVRNLEESTIFVTADVHQSPEPLSTEKIKLSKDECGLFKEPIVVVKDIFKHGKSSCKSISIPACDEFHEIPLQLQLLEHCSSLKIIPEESDHSQDQAEGIPKVKSKNDEPLTIEENIMQTSNEEKRYMRKRSSIINYKEPPANIKLRR